MEQKEPTKNKLVQEVSEDTKATPQKKERKGENTVTGGSGSVQDKELELELVTKKMIDTLKKNEITTDSMEKVQQATPPTNTTQSASKITALSAVQKAVMGPLAKMQAQQAAMKAAIEGPFVKIQKQTEAIAKQAAMEGPAVKIIQQNKAMQAAMGGPAVIKMLQQNEAMWAAVEGPIAKMQEQQAAINKVISPLKESYLDAKGVLNGMTDIISTTQSILTGIANSDAFKTIQSTLSCLKVNEDTIKALGEAVKVMQELDPFLEEEIAALKEKYPDSNWNNISIKDLSWGEYSACLQGKGEGIWPIIFKGALERQSRSLKNKKAATKALAAHHQQALTSIGKRLMILTKSPYQTALTTTTSSKATTGIFRVEETDTKGKGVRYLAVDVDTSFLQALCKIVFINEINGGPDEIEVYFPKLAQELGLNLHKYNDTKSNTEARTMYVLKILRDMENIWGVIGNTVYKVISVNSYTPETEILTFASPYLHKIISDNMQIEEQSLKSGKKFAPWQCDLLHATAVAERNKAAVEMATRILVGVQQRGTTPDAKLAANKKKHFKDETAVTYKITVRGLITDCPQIRERLKAQKNTSTKTQTLKRTIKAMYRILKNKSDLCRYYQGLEIKEIMPTMTTLDDFITVVHHGQDPAYKRPALPLKPTTQDV